MGAPGHADIGDSMEVRLHEIDCDEDGPLDLSEKRIPIRLEQNG